MSMVTPGNHFQHDWTTRFPMITDNVAMQSPRFYRELLLWGTFPEHAGETVLTCIAILCLHFTFNNGVLNYYINLLHNMIHVTGISIDTYRNTFWTDTWNIWYSRCDYVLCVELKSPFFKSNRDTIEILSSWHQLLGLRSGCRVSVQWSQKFLQRWLPTADSPETFLSNSTALHPTDEFFTKYPAFNYCVALEFSSVTICVQPT